MIKLNGKKILITGASGFIGRLTAIKLSMLGAKVIISGRNKEKLKSVLSELHGEGHFAIPFDIYEVDKIKDFIKSVVEIDGDKLSGFVYCTGTYPIRPLKSVNYNYLHDMMLINYYGFIEMVKCFSDKRICTEKSSVVVLSSYASIRGDRGQLAYSASKGAIDSSIIVIAKELYTKGIRINSIRPAALLPEDIKMEDLPSAIVQSIENMKTGPINPINIAEHIAFLISDYSNGVSGKCFDVKGYLS